MVFIPRRGPPVETTDGSLSLPLRDSSWDPVGTGCEDSWNGDLMMLSAIVEIEALDTLEWGEWDLVITGDAIPFRRGNSRC